jgi:hypothetical protein
MGGSVPYSRARNRLRSDAGLRQQAAVLIVAALLFGLDAGLAAQAPGRPGSRAPGPARDTSAPATQDIDLPDGRITGSVRAADTGRPVKRARVSISAPQLTQGRGTLTDDEGGFTFEALPQGRYSLTVSKSGFVSLSYGQRRPLQPGTPLQLADGQELKGLEFRLPRGSVIAGHIFDDSGDPLPAANVRLMRYQFTQGQRQLVPVDNTQTDDRGYYRMWGLNPGEYYVSAVSRSLNIGGRGAPPASPGAPAARGGGRGRGFFPAPPIEAAPPTEQVGYAPTFFPGVPSINEAMPVTVGLSVELGDIDFGLLLVRTSRISGKVTSPDGTATTAGNVNLIPDDGPAGRMGTNFGARIEWDGSFTINNVPPGRYTLRARADDTVTPSYAAQPITIANADMPDLTIILAPAATISGTVTFVGTQSAQLPDITQVRVTAPSSESGTLGPTANARVGRDGRFTIEGVPAGQHLIRTQGAQRGWMLKSVTVDGRETIDTPLELRSGASVTGVALVFTDKLSEVNGTVKDDRGIPFTEYTVLAFPDDPALWRSQARQILTARPDQNGRFQMRGLPPGDYLLTTIDPTEPGEWFEPQFLDQHRPGAARLTIGEGDVKTHDFTISR